MDPKHGSRGSPDMEIGNHDPFEFPVLLSSSEKTPNA